MRRRTKWTIGGVLAGALLVGGIGTGVAQQAASDDDRPLTGATHARATAAALEATGGGRVTDTEHGDDGAAYGVEVLLDDGRQVEVNLDRTFRVTGQEPDDDSDDRPLTGESYDRATAAALEATGGGRVTDTEHGDDGAAYGVEVLLDDGRQVEVNLDRNYEVISQELDDDANESDEPDDD